MLSKKWVIDCCLFSTHVSNISAISYWKQCTFRWDCDDVCFVLLTNKLSWIFIVLAHWNNSQWVVISLNTLSWFKANWYLFLHHNFKLSRVKDSEFQQLNTIFNRLFVLNHYNFAGTIQWNVTKSECLDI